MQLSESDIHNIDQRFESLFLQIEELKKALLAAKQNQAALKQENARLNQLVRIHKNSMKALEKSVQTSKNANVLSQKDKTSVKHVLNKLIEEVDKCMLLLLSEK
jgi:chromosome segregation ATPase